MGQGRSHSRSMPGCGPMRPAVPGHVGEVGVLRLPRAFLRGAVCAAQLIRTHCSHASSAATGGSYGASGGSKTSFTMDATAARPGGDLFDT